MKTMLNGRDLVDLEKPVWGTPSRFHFPNPPPHLHSVSIGSFNQDDLELFIGMITIENPQPKSIGLHHSLFLYKDIHLGWGRPKRHSIYSAKLPSFEDFQSDRW